jgi:methylthioribose-1-phosphate isomerase
VDVNFDGFSIRYVNGNLSVLNQQALPQKEEWISIKDTDHMVSVIKALQVRGAPLIGIAACLTLAFELEQNSNLSQPEFVEKLEALRDSRPTAVNLMNYLDMLLDEINNNGFNVSALVSKIESICIEDQNLCNSMSEHGAALVSDNDVILTHCNTGSLATAGVGTALGVISRNSKSRKAKCIGQATQKQSIRGFNSGLSREVKNYSID